MLEYTLPLVIFFLSAAVLLFSDLPDRFQKLLARTMNGEQQGEILRVSPWGAVNPTPGVSNTLPGLKTAQVELNSGEVITVQNYPSDLAKLVETTGANGTTKRLLATLEEAIAELEAAGEIDSEQAGQLRDLANQGHRIAKVEDVIYKFLNDPNNASPGGEFNKLTLNFEGETMTIQRLASWIGWDGSDISSIDDLYADPLATRQFAGKELANFLDLYQQAQSSGAMQNPSIQALVEDLSSKITLLGGAVEHGVDNIGNSYSSNEEAKAAFDKKVIQGAATVTDSNSAGICTLGGDEDSGKQCS